MPVLAVIALLAGAQPDIGTIERARTQSEIASGPERRAAATGEAFGMGDVLLADKTGRIYARLIDDTVIFVGADAQLTIDEYVFDPERSVGEVSLSLTRGAFRMISGNAGKQAERRITVEAPVASMAIRGTDVWFGEIDGAFGVLLLTGIVEVTTDAGTVRLDEPGEGVSVVSRQSAPGTPAIWTPAKRARALALTSF
jgi:hypothetical protein